MHGGLGDDADFVIVQAMAPPGLDLRIQGAHRRGGRALISIGIGGIQAGLVGDDDPVRLAPLSRHSATTASSPSHGRAAMQAGSTRRRWSTC